MAFATSLNFTSANEDGRTELEALRLSSADDVLCLTASGTRPLDLLLGDPGRVTAIDTNPAQNALLRLKIAALKAFDDDDYLAYLGVAEHPDRAALHQRVRKALSTDDAAFWDARSGVIASGVWHAGRWERVLRLGARGLSLWRGRAIQQVFAAASLGEQEVAWKQGIDGPVWRGVLRLLARRWLWTRLVGEPGGAFLPPPSVAAGAIADRLNAASGAFLFSDSDFLTLMLRGQCGPGTALPVHMQPGNLAVVRARLDRIEIANRDLRELEPGREFSAFSLSDFGSYTDSAKYEACWAGIVRSAASQARFCERVLLNELPAPSFAIQDSPLSARLSAEDKAAIYEIRAGVMDRSA
ncbi:MAG: DUF3419 family protein [Pseudomonadota bacterium]